MGKLKELKTTQAIVLDILQNEPQARNSDMFLYVKVCERLNPQALKQPFWYVLSALKEFNLPNTETVRRTRQKIQAEHPELCGSANVEAQRMLNADAFKEFARR